MAAVVADRRPRNRQRRGGALLAALWLVVMLSAAGLQVGLAARERRVLGLTAADRARETAALQGALAHVQAELEWPGNRSRVAKGRQGRLMAADDPWSNLEARFANGVLVGDTRVTVRVIDLGTVVNVNVAGESQLAELFAQVLRDRPAADPLAQAMLDWRDTDDFPRAAGAEASAYRRDRRVVLPANGPFGTLDELAEVMGMTDDRLARLRPYLTVDGNVQRVNLNAAPEPVLRTVPGMTPPVLAVILALRSAGRRVESIPALASAVQSRGNLGRGGAASGEYMALVRSLDESTTLVTRDVLLEFTADGHTNPRASRLRAVLTRGRDGSAGIGAVRW